MTWGLMALDRKRLLTDCVKRDIIMLLYSKTSGLFGPKRSKHFIVFIML